MIGTVVTSALSGLALYMVAKVNAKAHTIEEKVDGQLTETIALKQAVAFGKGEDKQRDRQEMRDAVKAEVKQANGN